MRKIVALLLTLAVGPVATAEASSPGKPREAVREPPKASAPVRAPGAAAEAPATRAICTEDCGRPALAPARRLENPAVPARR